MKIQGSVNSGSSMVSPGPITASGIFQEHVQRPGLALRVLPVVGDAGQDLARARQRRPESGRVHGQCRTFGGKLFQRRSQGREIVDDALHGELRGIRQFDRAGEADDAAIGEQAGQDGFPAGGLKQDQFHLLAVP